MSLAKGVEKQLLPRPPRLLSVTTGYDWREFDVWLQKLYSLIGMPQTDAYNIPTSLQGTQDVAMEGAFTVDPSAEIQKLRQDLEQLRTEMNMGAS